MATISGPHILWVNNSGNALGGTLQCTADCIKALPDCKHTVLSIGSAFSEDAPQLLPDIQLIHKDSVQRVAGRVEPDIIVYQNTHERSMPKRAPNGAFQVYYQHSAFPTMKPGTRCDRYFTVSKYLARTLGVSEDTVLYQPVSTPKGSSVARARTEGIRICTPNGRKWHKKDWYPFVEAVSQKFPMSLVCDLGKRDVPMGCTIYKPCLSARSAFWEVGFFLYTSSLPETYGRTVKEAQRCGCVPIVSDMGGFVEQIENEDGPDYGFLIRKPDEALEAVETVMKDYDWWECHVQKRGNEQGSLQRWRTEFLERIQ